MTETAKRDVWTYDGIGPAVIGHGFAHRHEGTRPPNKNRVSTFIKASQLKIVRVFPEPKFPSQRPGTHRHLLARQSSVANDDSSPLSTILEETNEQLELERRTPINKFHCEGGPNKTVQGFLSKIYSALASRYAPGDPQPSTSGPTSGTERPLDNTRTLEESPLEPGPKSDAANASDETLQSEAGISSACSSGPNDEQMLETMSQATILGKGKGKAVAVNDGNTHSHDFIVRERPIDSNSGKENAIAEPECFHSAETDSAKAESPSQSRCSTASEDKIFQFQF
ncbi:hypothetical protein OPT61_g988 [Boeremia exigua]|uniref:Uncharacterized protein n=1 Tax=Boeremia exigua TaxID=749465 RepID=A0ACC2IS02_9PLEO|nr:hypothetical protein OPT61_g988 [Boeremia exigua]